jgi:hypothetical protein
MTKRKDFVSDGLVTLRHKYVDEQLKALSSDDDVSASYEAGKVDKNLSIQEQQMQIYYQTRSDLEIRMNQQLTLISEHIEKLKQDVDKCENSQRNLEKLIEIFSEMPRSIDFDDKSDSLKRLEQLRVEFFNLKTVCSSAMEKHSIPVNGNGNSNGNTPQLSLLPELNSLSQLQMFKMGLFLALPLIIGIIIGCVIIAWIMLVTMGG